MTDIFDPNHPPVCYAIGDYLWELYKKRFNKKYSTEEEEESTRLKGRKGP